MNHLRTSAGFSEIDLCTDAVHGCPSCLMVEHGISRRGFRLYPAQLPSLGIADLITQFRGLRSAGLKIELPGMDALNPCRHPFRPVRAGTSVDRVVTRPLSSARFVYSQNGYYHSQYGNYC